MITAPGVALWSEGNEVAALDSGEGGRLQLCDAEGRVVARFPD